MNPRYALIKTNSGSRCIARVILPSNVCTEGEVWKRLMLLILCHAMVVSLFMIAGHRIFPMTIVESNGYAWAANIKRLLQETCNTVSNSKNKKLSTKNYLKLQKRFRNIIIRGEKELPPIPPKPNGKRSKIAKSDAHNLLERLKDNEQAVWLFAKNSHVSFTNNRAERDLRMAKVKQKVSGCFRTQIYAQAYCRISSYLQTMANKGHNPLIAIQMILAVNGAVGGE